MKKYLTSEEILNYKNYKYESIDNTFLTSQYKKIWDLIENFIPYKLHPNVITISGLFGILCGFILYQNYNFVKLMGLAVFYYLNSDGIDGIHARKTSSTSIIGEYFDHLIDMVNLGFITDSLLRQLGICDIFLKNLCIITACFCFIIPHFESTITNKMIFKGTSDVSTILTIIVLIFLFDIRLPEILLNNNFIFMIIICVLLSHVYNYFRILINLNTDNINLHCALIIFLWYTLKFLILSFKTNIYPFAHSLTDTILLLELINYKIFKKNMGYLILFFPILFIINPLIVSSIAINYQIYVINMIASQLDIKIFEVQDKKVLRVFCCGVFDMCHLGHMELFKKIFNSFAPHEIKLIVGVHNDLSCSQYKRLPIINELIRYRTVELCKYVDSVIPNCPLIITKEFIQLNSIDVVIIGEEYKNAGDKKWYPGAFELNNYKYIERFDEISSSDIIKKIKSIK